MYCDAIVAGSANIQNHPEITYQIIILLIPEMYMFARRSIHLGYHPSLLVFGLVFISETFLLLVIGNAWLTLDSPGYVVRSAVVGAIHTIAEVSFDIHHKII